MTSVGLLLVYFLLGYALVGLILGYVVSNVVYKETKNHTDAYSMGIVSAVLWPLAILVITVGTIWLGVIKPVLTPKAVRDKEKAAYEARKQEAINKGLDPKKVSKRFIPQYEDAE